MNDAFVFMGGTFDPIHNGHLRTALEIQQWLGVAQVHLIPARVPVHRERPGCTSAQRLAMVQAAVAEEPALVADAREIESAQASYSLYTLQALRAERGERAPICMVMGMDAYLSLPGWHEWRAFLNYAHIIVVARPGYRFQPSDEMAEFTDAHRVTEKETLLERAHGHVLIHEMTPLGISATQIRELAAQGRSPRYLIPDPVWAYIKAHSLYGYHEH